MSRIDWLVLKRLASRIGVTIAVIYGLVALAESLDTWRFEQLSRIGGAPMAILAIATSAARWSIRTLSVTVLIGAIIGLLDLQARRELTVIRATGISIWTVLRWPLLATAIFGIAIAVYVDVVTVQVNRALSLSLPQDTGAISANGTLWLEQRAEGLSYVLSAARPHRSGLEVEEVSVFTRSGNLADRITAPHARLVDGAWLFKTATLHRAGSQPQTVSDLAVPTTTTPADMLAKFASTQDLTIFELSGMLSTQITDPQLRSAMATRLMRLLSLPVLLAGSLLIAFAFTAGYRRTNKYGAAVLYGVVLGFVVFVITEMADRAGSAGVLDPLLAAVGPAGVAIVIGLTILLHKEDGRAR
ncbi:lipopolysaccharide export system permease protein [Devosia enhydra]|uniref:Lipopolysaccharide export system permease protein n=1 Tax=Devosia enhydra TaxID=665118 RepID=A0A1K2HSK0_9HYPH|nr:LptF/LptG family permease [Devosia enhydra]SFZ80895.1 lipopolysaccharide export system permease protein [Devosia enhydra]